MNQNLVTVNTFVAVLTLLLWCWPVMVGAQVDVDFSVEVRDMTAVATFVTPTPCTEYELSWEEDGDTVSHAAGDVCIQITEEQTLRHTYSKAGNYTVTLDTVGETFTEEVTVPTEVLTFSLGDVSSINALWIDPNKRIADEEYYLYTVRLKSGQLVMFEVAAFTTQEWRDEAFAEAGFKGDVDALLALVEDDEAIDLPGSDVPPLPPAPPSPDTELNALYQQLVVLLQALLEQLQQDAQM